MQNTEPVAIRLPLNRLAANAEYQQYSRPLNEQEARDLRASIESAGCILQPLIVEYVQSKTKYEVIDGYNRWTNAEALGFVDVPCIQVFTEQQRLEALMANANRRQLSAEERRALLAKGRTAFASAAQKLIKPLQALYAKGELHKILGPANVLYLMNCSMEKQEEIYKKVQLAFGAPAGVAGQDTALQQRIESLSNQVASIQRTKEHLEAELEAAATVKTELERKLDTVTKNLEDLADKKAGQKKVALEDRVKKLTEEMATLMKAHQDASRRAKVLEEQLSTAEAEKKAAQLYARNAERQAQQANQRLASPKIVISNFESIHKLIEAIKAQIVAAKPLAPEDDKLIQDQIAQTTSLLADLDNTLRSTPGDVIHFHRHVKPRGSNQDSQVNHPTAEAGGL